MNIYIDESGSFVSASNKGAWNVVAAYASPETDTIKLEQCLGRLKIKNGNKNSDELKLRKVKESIYFEFIKEISGLNGVLFCTATDDGLNEKDKVLEHQKRQAELMLANVDQMKYESGRKAVKYLTSQLEKLSPQLYVQLCCQLNLIFNAVGRMIPFFIQRNQNSLKKFRWRVDQKNSSKPDFEDAFEKFSPAFLQTRSISEPMAIIEGYDYTCLKKYRYQKGQLPEYLKEGYDGLDDAGGLDIQKIIRDDIKFVDSQDVIGVQVVDLIVSGVRRCLRQEFANNEKAAHLLGGLMVEAQYNRVPINLVIYADESKLDNDTAKLLNIMIRSCKAMIYKN